MTRRWDVEVESTAVTTFEVEAGTLEEAMEKASEQYFQLESEFVQPGHVSIKVSSEDGEETAEDEIY